MVADEFKKFTAARVCFIWASLWIIGRIFMWSYLTTSNANIRVLITFVAIGLVGTCTSEGMRLISAREAKIDNNAQEGKQPPSPSPSGTTVNQEKGTNSPIQVGDHNIVNYNLGNPKSDAKLNSKLDEIKKLIESQNKEATEKALLRKYPLGYVIFDVDHSNQVIPYAAHKILDKYELDWSGVGVSIPSPGRVVVKLPGLQAKDGSVGLSGGSTGGPLRVGNLGGFGADDLVVWAEILAIGKDGIVFLVGFDKEPVRPRPTRAR